MVNVIIAMKKHRLNVKNVVHSFVKNIVTDGQLNLNPEYGKQEFIVMNAVKFYQ